MDLLTDRLIWSTSCQEREVVLTELWTVVLVLSHGQVSVDPRLSTNKQVETESQYEEFVVAKRINCDHINHVRGIPDVDITNNKLILQLQQLVRNTVCVYLSKAERNPAMTNQSKKIKSFTGWTTTVLFQKKKRRLRKDANALEKEADYIAIAIAIEVEEKHDWSCIANTLRNTAIQKLADIQAVDL